MQVPEIDTDIPYATYPPTFETLQQRVGAMFASLAEIADEVEVTDGDIFMSRDILEGRREATPRALSSPGTVVHLKALLNEYDKAVIEDAAQLRRYVTNKLIEESVNADPRVRMKALELLGKVSDVGLFTEKTEITMRHRPTEELEQLLRERLMKTIDVDVPPTPTEPTGALQPPQPFTPTPPHNP